jgi:hypothetical protein
MYVDHHGNPKAENRRSDFGRVDCRYDVTHKCPHGTTLVETAVDLLGQVSPELTVGSLSVNRTEWILMMNT